jgi:hypothetical protein
MRHVRTSFPSELINVVGECRMKVGGKGSLDNSCELQATAAIKPQKYWPMDLLKNNGFWAKLFFNIHQVVFMAKCTIEPDDQKSQ